MAYSRNPVWVDGPSGGTPITAATLNNIETGLVNAAQIADTANATAARFAGFGVPLLSGHGTPVGVTPCAVVGGRYFDIDSDDVFRCTVASSTAAGTTWALSNSKREVIQTVAGTSYTITAGDLGTRIRFTNTAAITVNISAGLPIGSTFDLFQAGTGVINVVGASGVVIEPTSVSSNGQNSTLSFVCDSTNVWVNTLDSAGGAGPSITFPGIVTGVGASAPAAGQAIVTWTAPSNGGSAITGYTINYSGTATGSATAGPSSTSTTITGLAQGPYTFTVTATNGFGTQPTQSSPSPTVTVTPTSNTTLPGAPTNVAGTPGVSLVNLTWTAPTNTGGSGVTISGYVISWAGTASGSHTVTGNPAPTSYQVTGLAAGPYTFTVAAQNTVGTGSSSSASQQITVTSSGANAPGAPASASATAGAAGAMTAHVIWTAPASNGGAAITGYVITPSGPSGSPITVTGATTFSTDFSGLTAGAYTFGVVAVNNVGPGPATTTTQIIVQGTSTAINLLPLAVADFSLAPSGYTGGSAVPTSALAAGSGTPAFTGSSIITASPTSTSLGYFQPQATSGNCAAVTPGTQYTALIYAKPSAAGFSGSAQIQWYNSAMTLLSYSKGTVTALTSGAQNALSVTVPSAPANAAFATIQCTQDVNVAGQTVQWSCGQISQAASLSTWTAPSTNGATVPTAAPTGLTATGGVGVANFNWAAFPAGSNGGSDVNGFTLVLTPTS